MLQILALLVVLVIMELFNVMVHVWVLMLILPMVQLVIEILVVVQAR